MSFVLYICFYIYILFILFIICPINFYVSVSGPVDDPSTKDTQVTNTPPTDEKLIGIIIGAVAALIILLLCVIVFCILRARRNKFDKSKQMETPIAYNLNDLRAMTNNSMKMSKYIEKIKVQILNHDYRHLFLLSMPIPPIHVHYSCPSPLSTLDVDIGAGHG